MSFLLGLSSLGQSVWADQISRSMLETGELERLVRDDGITGVTSNPTIFAGAITGSSDYDAHIDKLAGDGAGTLDIYSTLVARDIRDACDVLRPVWDRTSGVDGYVSVEVSPDLAGDTDGTVADAHEWVKRIDKPNLLIKVPATPAGVPAIERLIGDGVSVNVTLIFSLERYREVADAYLNGLRHRQAAGGDLSRISSVASFFVSRFDSEVDRRLLDIGTPEALNLIGTTAIANTRAAYGSFLQAFSGPEWEALRADGALFQRPLWASTSTKDPDYPDTLYVDELAANRTVNTMPIQTIDAYRDHGNPNPTTFDGDSIQQANLTLERLVDSGVDYDEVVAVLEDEGVDKFATSYHELLDSIQEQAEQ